MQNNQRSARRYHNFVLHLWEEGGSLPNAPPVWRFSLTYPHSGERIGFRSLQDLSNFLQQWTQSPTQPIEGDNHADP